MNSHGARETAENQWASDTPAPTAGKRGQRPFPIAKPARLRRFFSVFVRVFLFAYLSAAIQAAAAPVSFSKQIAPILADQCLECHRADKAKGSYRLDTFEQLSKAGDSEEAPLVPGKPDASFLHQLLITPDDADRMPKKADPLPEKDIALIKQWIAEGAKFDGADPKAALASLIPQERVQSPDKYPRPIPVTALAVNGDGKVLLSSGFHEVLAWDPENAKLRGRIQGLPERILGLSFIEGGPWFAVAGGTPGRSGEVWLVNYANPSERKRLVQMRDCALCAVTSPDGKFLVTGGADNRVRGFSLPDGKPIWNIESHADWVLAVATSPDGRHVATASRDRTAKLIETETGVIDATFTAHAVPVLSVAFSPDGKEIISGGNDGQIRRWDLNGTAKKDTTLRPSGKAEILALAFRDQNTPLAGLSTGHVTEMDVKARKTKRHLTTHPDRVNAIVLQGKRDEAALFSGGHDGQIRLIEIKEGKELRKFVASPGW